MGHEINGLTIDNYLSFNNYFYLSSCLNSVNYPSI